MKFKPGFALLRLSRRSRSLILRCLAGNDCGWQELFERYRRHVERRVAYQLRAYSIQKADQEDIAERVWIALWQQDQKQLRKFDSARGRLKTFLDLQVKQEVKLYFRRQKSASRAPELRESLEGFEISAWDPSLEVAAVLAEMHWLFSADERKFMQDRLLNRAKAHGKVRPFTAAEGIMEKRMYQKLRAYLYSQR